LEPEQRFAKEHSGYVGDDVFDISEHHSTESCSSQAWSVPPTSIVHSKLDYCNSLYYGVPKYQIHRLQHIQNALSQSVVQAPKFQHITPILKYLKWRKVSVRIKHKIISLTKFMFRIFMTSYLFSLILVTTHVTLVKPSSSSVTHRSFRHASRRFWNQGCYTR